MEQVQVALKKAVDAEAEHETTATIGDEEDDDADENGSQGKNYERLHSALPPTNGDFIMTSEILTTDHDLAPPLISRPPNQPVHILTPSLECTSALK